MAATDLQYIFLNPVRADRVDDFESWLRIDVVPAVRRFRPEINGRWEVLRSTEERDGTVVVAFVVRGGEESDWDLQPLLEQALGSEGAERSLEAMSEMLTEPAVRVGLPLGGGRLNRGGCQRSNGRAAPARRVVVLQAWLFCASPLAARSLKA